MAPQTLSQVSEVEVVSDLYSHIESSGGDYNNMREQLEAVDGLSDVLVKVVEAEENVEDAFSRLDNAVLPNARFDGEGSGEWVDRPSADLRKIARSLSDAESALAEAVDMVQNADQDLTPDGFKFGAHTSLESALQYLHSDVDNMKGMAENAK